MMLWSRYTICSLSVKASFSARYADQECLYWSGVNTLPTQHRHTADRISQRMTAEGHKVASLHGAKDAAERDAIIDSFREGREKVLITTNVIARGIDIMQVNMVVNYDLPLLGERGERYTTDNTRPDIETYI